MQQGIDSREVLIARSNRAFFAGAITSQMLRNSLFTETLIKAHSAPASYPFCQMGYVGRMTIDATTLDKRDLSELRQAVWDAASRLADGIGGDLSQRAVVHQGRYRFRFVISSYWSDHGSPSDDPTTFLDGEDLRRQVDLQIDRL